jgi:hypothetical protein
MHFQESIVDTGIVVSLLAVVMFSGISAARADVTLPDCADLQKWIATVDPKKRWNPVEGSRAWLPAAFQSPAFVETFGTAPLKWTQAEAREVSKHLFECGTEAGEAGDRHARTLLYGARGWFQSNLVGVLVAHSRAVAAAEREAENAARREKIQKQQEARLAAEQQHRQERRQMEVTRMNALQAALDDVVNQPDSLRLLQSLIVLRDTNPRDALAVNSAIGRFGQKAGTLLGQARSLQLTMQDDPIGPALDKRIEELRKAIFEDYTKRIDALSAAELGALRFLARWEGEVREELADALGPPMTSNLLTHIADRHRGIEDDILAELMKRIDGAAGLPKATDGLAQVQESINRGHQVGLSPERQERLRTHAVDVEVGLAEKTVIEAEAALAGVSENLDGLRFLLNTIPRADRPPLSHAPRAVLASYRDAARERLDDVAAEAFSEFKDALNDVPESQQGLYLIERTVVADKTFSLISPDIRKDYEEAVNQRQDEIQTALREAAEDARREAIARGGDADLIGHVFENEGTGLSVGFLDEKLAVVGLNGREDMAPYKVRGNQVLVYGKGMTLQLNRSGAGPDTALEWLGKVLKRHEQ